MYSYFFVSLILVQTYGAPTDVTPQPIDVNVYEGSVTQTAEPLHYETTGSYETTSESYAPKEVTTMVYPTKDQYTDTTPSAPVIEVVEETPKRVVFESHKIINGGKHLSEAITAKIVGPVVIFNSKVAAAAGALPPMLAAKGAILGSAIATPIEIGAVVSSSIVSGVTGKLVAVPISMATKSLSKFVVAAEQGRELWDFNVEHGGEILKEGVIRMGHIILKPIAVIVGASTAVSGAGVGIAGTGIKGVGVGVEKVGAKMIATGLAAKGLGTVIIKSQFVK